MKQKTYYHIILDQSGSMQDCIKPTVAGFNRQLQTIRSVQERFPEQEITIGLTCFNGEVVPAFFSQKPSRVRGLSTSTYCPNGSTALYDAIGLTVKKLRRAANHELAEGLATVVVVVITDGHENASRSYSGSQIRSLIRSLEATKKWTFSYLGATVDAVEVATDLNFRPHNSMAFEKSCMDSTFNKLSRSMDAYMLKKQIGGDIDQFLEP